MEAFRSRYEWRALSRNFPSLTIGLILAFRESRRKLYVTEQEEFANRRRSRFQGQEGSWHVASENRFRKSRLGSHCGAYNDGPFTFDRAAQTRSNENGKKL